MWVCDCSFVCVVVWWFIEACVSLCPWLVGCLCLCVLACFVCNFRYVFVPHSHFWGLFCALHFGGPWDSIVSPGAPFRYLGRKFILFLLLGE